MRELKHSKIVVSPFGWGEITLKDFEVFLTGAMMLKPSMKHMNTWPDFYEDGVTILDHQWDLADLESKIDWALDNEAERLAIAEAGQSRYLDHTSGPKAAELFVKHLTGVLAI